MQTYKEYSPTQWDAKGAFGLPGDHLVPAFIQTRDSDALERSNFTCFKAMLDKEGIDYKIHRFGHWGPGWYEIFLVPPTEDARRVIKEAESAIENYPILNEDHYSELEWNEASEYWARLSVRDRAEIIRDKSRSVSIFAARRAELPANDDNGAIFDYLRG